jgi:hypothetical protein
MMKLQPRLNSLSVAAILWSAPNQGLREMEVANKGVGQDHSDLDHEPTKKIFDDMRAGIHRLKNLKD